MVTALLGDLKRMPATAALLEGRSCPMTDALISRTEGPARTASVRRTTMTARVSAPVALRPKKEEDYFLRGFRPFWARCWPRPIFFASSERAAA